MIKKLCIYPSDIILLTDKSESHARKEIQKLRIALKKEKHQKVSIKEYCQYYDFDYNDVLSALEKPVFKKVS